MDYETLLSENAKQENFENFLYKLHRKYFNIYELTDFLRVQGYKAFYNNIKHFRKAVYK